MSEVFFTDLGLRKPDISLGIHGGSHGQQTGRMLIALERVLVRLRPHVVIVYGDTNSTLAGTIAAAKLAIPVAHVEAGMRSFNRAIPEELNRIVADHLSTFLFCSTARAADWLRSEGMLKNVYVVGDVMLDAFLEHTRRARQQSTILRRLSLQLKAYHLATLHRAGNTDDAGRLRSIISAFRRIGAPIVLPLHPRTRKRLKTFKLTGLLRRTANVRVIRPVGYLDTLELERNAKTILTDSGGIQKEAFFFRVPCITLRDETEWTETTESGWNTLVGVRPEQIIKAVRRAFRPRRQPKPFGSGKASKRIVEILQKRLG